MTTNEAIAAEVQRRLITKAWRSDLATTCEALQQLLAQHDTSRRMAVRLVAAWYPDEVAAVTK
jgi:putative heme degradation protein